MKLYFYDPPKLVRLQIIKQGEETKYINLCETNMKEVEEYVKKVISSVPISPFSKGRLTSINIREAIGGKNGKAKNISFKGLDTQSTYALLINHLNNKNFNKTVKP